MTKKRSPAALSAKDSQNDAQRIAKVVMMPEASAAAVIQPFAKGSFGDANIPLLLDELRDRTGKLHAGDLKHCETMLLGQAEALQAIFVSLARRASNQQYLKQYETYLRLALKAQNQSRMTLETLATMKNPPVVIARQANIANGPQQVNNGVPIAPAHTQETQNEQNELLEANYGKRLDTRAPETASGANQALEAVGTLHRA
ncbi:MAG: hypothetical protein PHH47_13695 [Gallionella sp.]|nr:hypothetical protein [Gallionella sp.]MDD4946568.1 hypothetical protein [Gallionella sp.]